MSKIDRWIDNKVVQNIFVWCFLFVIFLFVVQAENRLFAAAVFIVFVAPPVYIQNLKILPIFFKNKKGFATILFLANTALFSFVVVYFLSDALVNFEYKMIFNAFGGMLLVLIFGSALKIARDSFVRRQEEKDAELKLLKAQLNPHFLFNTLNNLYGLSVVKSDKLPNLMLKLSDLLRYSLYETSLNLVSLHKEIAYLENYISLEKIRLEDKSKIFFNISGETSTKKIAPMLFIVFVENAFKHLGTSEAKKSYVNIELSVTAKEINFFCENTIENNDKNTTNIEKGKSGIGLKNAKKRLQLIYPNKHSFTIEKNEDSFKVILNISN